MICNTSSKKLNESTR